MATKNESKRKKIESLRYLEYYDMQPQLDKLFKESQEGETFKDLMNLILLPENIMLAYRNMKSNTGSITPGTDNLTIKDIAKLTPEQLVNKVRRILANYTPRPVRRKEIPKPNGKTRPLGIPCIWDRLIQQAILQIMEPICEAKFSDNSYGFRPNRSAENAIARMNQCMQLANLHYAVEVDIRSFFDEVNHSKLIKQIWTMGIQDKKLIYIIRRMLTAEIQMPDNTVIKPARGTPQGGILSPLLANIVLNELDHWIESQWQEHPVCHKYTDNLKHKSKSGAPIRSHGYRAMRSTGLKEMQIVRYADDFRILCRTHEQATKTMIAVTKWLNERLKLQVSKEKTRIVNLKTQYSEFLGFRLRVYKKGGKYVLKSRVSEKAIKSIKGKAKQYISEMTHPKNEKTQAESILKYNAFVMGEQNYYGIATLVGLDFSPIGYQVDKSLKTRFGKKLKRKPKTTVNANNAIIKRYGKSKQLRFINDRPIAPIGYIRQRTAMAKRKSVQKYTPEGRKVIHDNLEVDTRMLLALMRQPSFNRSMEFMDNRISLFSAQKGKCAVTHRKFDTVEEIHGHHIKPRKLGGDDKYKNLVLVSEPIHILIHAVEQDTIDEYLKALKLTKDAIKRLNKFRIHVGNEPI